MCSGRSSEAIAHTVQRLRDPVLRQKDEKAAEAGLRAGSAPCGRGRDCSPASAARRPLEQWAVFFFRDRLTTGLRSGKTGRELLGEVPWGRGDAH